MLSHPDLAVAEARPAPGAMAGVRCLVLGAGGFLGGALCGALRADGADVHAYGRRLPAAARTGIEAFWRTVRERSARRCPAQAVPWRALDERGVELDEALGLLELERLLPAIQALGRGDH